MAGGPSRPPRAQKRNLRLETRFCPVTAPSASPVCIPGGPWENERHSASSSGEVPDVWNLPCVSSFNFLPLPRGVSQSRCVLLSRGGHSDGRTGRLHRTTPRPLPCSSSETQGDKASPFLGFYAECKLTKIDRSWMAQTASAPVVGESSTEQGC